MQYYKEKKALFLEYFNQVAADRIRYRKKRAYYWNSITEYCNYYLRDDDRVLELGCGTGELLAAVKGAHKVGIDFSPAMVAQAKQQFPQLDVRVMDAENLELNEQFDTIIISNLVGVLTDIETCFEQLHKVCHENTRIIVTYYNYLWTGPIRFAEFIGLKKRMPEQSWLSRTDIENLLYLADFDVYRRNTGLLIPFNIPLVSWLFNKYLVRLPLLQYLAINQYFFARPKRKPERTTWEETYSTTVVIPARNESGNIENAILRLPKFGKHVEIIFMEGNSTDDTWETIQRIQEKYKDTHDIKIAQQDGKGKGDAVRKAYDMATGDILMILDADLTVPPEELPKFYKALASGKGEFINGCRLIYPLEKRSMRPLNILGNKFFSIAFSWLMEQPVKDTLCGTKVMFREDYIRLKANRKYFGEFDPFGDFDLLFGAYKLNLKIIDLPIRYQERVYGSTNISRFKHGFILLQMVLFALNKIKFK